MTAPGIHIPFTNRKSNETFMAFVAIDAIAKLDCGQYVRATALTNMEYKLRFEKLKARNNMKAPPHCENVSSGYLVIGKPGTRKQFEDWIPDQQFNELYKAIGSEYVDFFPFPAAR